MNMQQGIPRTSLEAVAVKVSKGEHRICLTISEHDRAVAVGPPLPDRTSALIVLRWLKGAWGDFEGAIHILTTGEAPEGARMVQGGSVDDRLRVIRGGKSGQPA